MWLRPRDTRRDPQSAASLAGESPNVGGGDYNRRDDTPICPTRRYTRRGPNDR